MQLGKMLNKQASAGANQAPYIANRHVQWDRVLLDDLDTMSFTGAERNRYALAPGDLLICEGGEIGRTAMWHGERDNVFFQKAIHRLRAKVDAVAPGYVLRYMRFASQRGLFAELSSQTSIAHLTQEKLARLPVRLPPVDEQRRITEILDTIDDAARKTEQIIVKLKRIKQGILHDLMTRGIDENGEVRDPDSRPDVFVDSPIGRVPKHWDTSPLGEFVAHIIDYRGRTPRKLGMEWGGHIPALSAMNVKMGAIDLSRETYYGSDELYTRWMTNGDPQRGDIVMTMEAPLGNVAQIPDERRYLLSQRVVLVRFKPCRLSNDFAAHQMRAERFQRHLTRWSTGTTATGIQRAKLIRIPIAAPPLEEQKQISAALTAADAKIQREEEHLSKLRLLKQGVMGDLLTGRVRVTPLLAESTP